MGVVVHLTGAIHALKEAVASEGAAQVVSGVLDAAVGVEVDATGWSALFQGVTKGSARKSCVAVPAEAPPEDAAGVAVHDGGQIPPAASHADGIYCYPLTVTDLYSRYLVGCKGLLSTRTDGVKKSFERLFREYGIPRAIRSDNGVPFASTGLGRLSRLSVWWIKLGIRPELTQPAHPEQNGSHERMHRTLKRATTRPVGGDLLGQQRRFDAFRLEFNTERPHESIGMKRPADLYRPSPRAFPSVVPSIEYPGHFEVRRVSRNGGIRWKNGWLNVSHPLIDEYVGLDEVDDGIWNLYFGSLLLGRFDERDEKLYAAFYAHRPWHRGGRAGRAAEASTQTDLRDLHSATTTR